MADSPAAASNEKEERQDRAQRYRARAGDILKLTDGDILPDQRERYLKSVHFTWNWPSRRSVTRSGT
jgi:hypothetical protein